MKTRSMATTIKLPKSLENKLLEQVVRDGYGLRGKSRWISEAIVNFLQLDNFPELVDIATDMEQLTSMVNMSFSSELMKQVDDAVIIIRKQYPTLEGVQSNIIRASIVQKLIAAR